MGVTNQEETVRMHKELVKEWGKGKNASEEKVKSLLALLKVSLGVSCSGIRRGVARVRWRGLVVLAGGYSWDGGALSRETRWMEQLIPVTASSLVRSCISSTCGAALVDLDGRHDQKFIRL